jgi:hypothetical protein
LSLFSSQKVGKSQKGSDSLGALPENDVYLYLKEVKDGVFAKSDWIFLNDRILFVRMAGLGFFVAKSVQSSYSEIIGKNAASALIKRLRDLRRKKSSTLSNQDIVNILSVDPKNMEMLYLDMDRVTFGRKFGGYHLTVSSKTITKIADIPWTKVSYKKVVLFFKARVGSRFMEV